MDEYDYLKVKSWNPPMLKTAVAIRHVHFEDLGAFEAVLTAAGYRVHYYDIGLNELWTLDAIQPDLVIVLGGPIGVYETDAYPFLSEEIDLLKARLAANRPTFGICLGAQLIAAALGAKVKPSGIKEIGLLPLTLTVDGEAGPLRHLTSVPVLHWHGDMFEIPQRAARLAETPLCRNQAFAIGPNILGVQFHPEADTAAGFERWLVGHACELAGAKIDARTLRQDAQACAGALHQAGRAMFSEWLKGLVP